MIQAVANLCLDRPTFCRRVLEDNDVLTLVLRTLDGLESLTPSFFETGIIHFLYIVVDFLPVYGIKLQELLKQLSVFIEPSLLDGDFDYTSISQLFIIYKDFASKFYSYKPPMH